ncbi:hypothetical protein ACFQ3N_18860 [Virgibacillus byunsanensis]|uniref:DUF3892 domain-containing protein n=1 Tax=Virgibacillus byunsanensis TaxID=570945 RepID=A0ABW3LPU0_9BACI
MEDEEIDRTKKNDEHIGIVSLVRQDEGYKRMDVLVIPNNTEELTKGKNKDEILKIARENNGSWYSIGEGEYKIGQTVKVFYDKNQNVLESNPPKKGAEIIRI